MASHTEYDKIAEMAGIPSVISEESIDSWMIKILQRNLKITIRKERYSCAGT